MVGMLTAFFAQGAAPAPPYPNEHDGGQYWYHGTGISEHSFDEDEDRDPETRPSGGSLRSPDTWEAEYGQNSSKHWNTGLGVHFTSRHHVARGFATNEGGYETRAHPGARVAHAMLHMANPKHYDSEYDLAEDATKYAQENGHHYITEPQRHDSEEKEHLFHGGHLSEIEDHDHLEYVDNATETDDRKMIHAVDHGEKPSTRRDYDQYLNLHPERPEIIEGFKDHLRKQGHDGVTYGNEYEAPIGHRCAVPFDDDQIHLRHWQWLHPSEQHRNKHAEGEDPPTQPEHLVQRNYSPSLGHHWTGPDGEHLARREDGLVETALSWSAPAGPRHAQPGLASTRLAGPCLACHEGSKLSVQASAPPKPDRGKPLPDGASDDEIIAHGDALRKVHNDWQSEIRGGLSEGRYTSREAKNAGYYGSGHDQGEGPETWDDEGHHGLKWKPLPHALWHVTTHKDEVLKYGLKSRDDLEQGRGKGLGGGESDTISFTEDPKVAHNIHRALHEYHSMLNIPLSEATRKMKDESDAGGYTHWVEGAIGKDGFERGLRGHVRHLDTHNLMSLPEAREKIHPQAEFDPGHSVMRAFPEHGLPERSSGFTRPATDDEAREQISSHYKSHVGARAHHGGPEDPLFSQNDVHGFAKMDPQQFAVIKAHPPPGAQGYQLSALGEWRTASSNAVHIDGVDESLHHTASMPATPRLALPHRDQPGHALPMSGYYFAALLPGYTHEHEWLPSHGIFSRTKSELDPILFGRRGKLRKCVKRVVLARMDAAVKEVYPDWRDWTRSYFAGGEASFWWGNHDLDILVGIDYPTFRKAHPEDADLSDAEISAKITRLWRIGYNSETWVAPWDGTEWHVTCFSNPASYRIQDIKPYAAYEIDNDKWIVKPPQVDETWGPGSFPEWMWVEAEGFLQAINAIEKMTDPKKRAREGAALYDYLHDHRRAAFGADGSGWDDPANVLWKYLEYHPSNPVEKLVGWAHEHNENLAPK